MIDATNRNTALASALVEELARSGVKHAVLSPGSRSSPVALALDREPEIELTVVLDERSAGFVALGTAMETGSPAVVACTSGSAAANFHPAVVEADQAGVPMIVLTSDRPPELRGIGAGQTIDQIGLYGTAARWFCEAGTHEADDAGLLHMRSIACRAWAESTGGRGPAHLNLSWRDPLGPDPRPDDVIASRDLAREGRSAGRPLTVPIAGREPGEQVVGALAEAVGRAERGLILAGRNLTPGLPEAIAELAVASGLPVLAEPTSGLRVGPHSDGTIAAYDLISRSQPAALAPDLVLRFGDMPTSKPLRTWLDAIGVDQIIIDPPGRWNEPSRTAGALVRADAVAVAVSVAERLETPTDPSWVGGWREAERKAQAAVDDVLAAAGDPTEPGIVRALGAALAAGDRLLIASSMPIRDAESFLPPALADARLLANRGANGIDGLISTAAGIARASGEPTWLLIGDLALAHDIGGLAAAAALDSPLRILVVDNAGGGIFDFLPQAGQVDAPAFERLFTTPSRLDIERAAALYGIGYSPLSGEADIAGLATTGTVIGHIRTERGGNVELHRRIAEAVTAAISST